MHYAQTDERPNRSPNPKHGTSPLLLGQWAHHPAHARLAGAAQSLARPVQARDDVASRPAECVAAAHTPRASQARGEHTSLCMVEETTTAQTRIFAKLAQLFPCFLKFFEVFVGFWTCRDLFGPIRIRSDASGCIRMLSEVFGRLWKNYKKI